jgi:hypothetical protein
MRCAGSGSIKSVDIFNATSGRWMTAALSVARHEIAATSLPEQGLAIFAGGYTGTGLRIFFELLILGDCVMLESGGACVGWREARF